MNVHATVPSADPPSEPKLMTSPSTTGTPWAGTIVSVPKTGVTTWPAAVPLVKVIVAKGVPPFTAALTMLAPPDTTAYCAP